MKEYDKIILNRLLTTYEGSKAARGENKGGRNIWFRITQQSLPEYFDLTETVYDDINRGAAKLEECGLAELKWKNGIEGHILEKAKLNLDCLTVAYDYVSRTPKEQKAAALQAYMEDFPSPCPVTEKCFAYIKERLQAGLSVKRYVDFDDLERFYDVIKGVEAVCRQTDECFAREFSMEVYGDSKTFESLSGSIREIFREFSDEEMSFENYGIVKHPVTVLIKGDFRLDLDGSCLDLGGLSQGIGLAGEDLGKLDFPGEQQLDAVVTVENLTAFYRFHMDKAAIVYLGGFSNSARITLLQKLHRAYPEASLFHFGDIDLGGIKIFLDLRKRTGLDFQPLLMERDVLEKHADSCRPLTAGDVSGLQRLREGGFAGLDETQAAKMKETIDWMILHKKKLEQEIVALALRKKASDADRQSFS